MSVCDYCAEMLPEMDDDRNTDAVWIMDHYRKHIEELLIEIERAGEGEWDGIPGLVIPDSWQGPRIQQLGDNT